MRLFFFSGGGGGGETLLSGVRDGQSESPPGQSRGLRHRLEFVGGEHDQLPGLRKVVTFPRTAQSSRHELRRVFARWRPAAVVADLPEAPQPAPDVVSVAEKDEVGKRDGLVPAVGGARVERNGNEVPVGGRNRPRGSRLLDTTLKFSAGL